VRRLRRQRCPAERYVHSISHYQITSGCLTNVWSSMTNDALTRGSLSGHRQHRLRALPDLRQRLVQRAALVVLPAGRCG